MTAPRTWLASLACSTPSLMLTFVASPIGYILSQCYQLLLFYFEAIIAILSNCYIFIDKVLMFLLFI